MLIPQIQPANVTEVSKFLGECVVGSDLARLFAASGLTDRSGESTKWRRIQWALDDSQTREGNANGVLAFIESLMSPARFADRASDYEVARSRLNTILAYSGVSCGPDGRCRPVAPAATISDAERRAQTLRARLQGRRIHPDVLKYCRADLMEQDYFTALFEASKGLFQDIRELSGLDSDGSMLVDAVFFGTRPILALNALESETERNLQKGFGFLLKGLNSSIRNPRAHVPKILWESDDDAADVLTLISLLRRMLDETFPTGYRPTS